jgi:hypothetical protein
MQYSVILVGQYFAGMMNNFRHQSRCAVKCARTLDKMKPNEKTTCLITDSDGKYLPRRLQ